MRKEIVYAIVAGILFGLVVAFGVWRANFSLSDQQSAKTEETADGSSLPQDSNQVGLTLAKPQDFEVSDTATIIISGLTAPESWLVISGENNDYLAPSQTDGSFEQEVDLIPGINEVIVTAFDRDNNSLSKKIVAIYSSEFVIPSQETTENATDSSDAVRQKIQEKVEKVLKSPRAYIGTITDISEGTMQITRFDFNSEDKGQKEIRQVSTASSTTYVKVQKGEAKTIKLADVAIGDFTVAMGFVNGNSVLEAQRVLLTDPYEITKRTAYQGKVISVSKTKIIIQSANGEEIEVVQDDKAKITKDLEGKTTKATFTEIKEGDKLIVVGQPDLKNFVARRIHIVVSAPDISPSPFSKTTQ